MSVSKTLTIQHIPLNPAHTLSSGEKIIGIAAFKNNIEPYGGFANTTLCTDPPKYPVPLSKYLTLNNQEQNISILGIKRKNGSLVTAFNWKSSENAYHAQKLLAFRQKFPEKSAIIDQMLLDLEEMPAPPNQIFLPGNFKNLVTKYSGSLSVIDEKDFHTKCSMSNSYQYMKFVVKQKLLQHKDLLDKAKACALAGIMPIEISQHDKVWASFIDGSGANQLGIIILELGNEFLINEGKGQPKISDPKMAYQELQSKLPLGYSTNLDGKQLHEYVETTGLFSTANVSISASSAKPAAKVAPAQPTKLVEPNKLSIRFKEVSSDNHEISLQFYSIEELLEFKQQFINKLLARDPNLSPEVAAATVEQIFKYYPNTTNPNDHKNKILYIKQAFNKSSDPLSPQYTPGVYKDKASGTTVIDFKDQRVRDVFLELTSIDSKEYKTQKDRLEKVYFESKVLDTDNSIITTNLSYQQHKPITYALNAHGAQTSEKLTLDPQHVILTPAPIDTAFTTVVADNSVLEQEIHKGQLLDTTGKWTAYNDSSHITNISFDTGDGFDTITSFAKYTKTKDTWKPINPDLKYDSENWGYFEKDLDATLIVRRAGNLIHIQGKDIKTYLEEVEQQYESIDLDANDKSLKLKPGATDQTNSVAKVGDVPVFCCFPQVHKIKVFSSTSLKEVSEQLKKIHGEDQVSVVVATCNAAPGANTIIVQGTEHPTKLSEFIKPLLPESLEPPKKKAAATKPISTLKIKTLDGTKTSKLDGKFDKVAINLYSETCKKHFTELIQKNKDNHEFKDVKYIHIKPTQDNQNTVGELRRTATAVNPGEILATVKLDTIEFSISEGKDTLINVQHLASIEFLKIQSKQSIQDNQIIIDINNYSPQDLKNFLELLNKIGKIPNITLELPSSKEQCTYGDNKLYTEQEYRDAVALINDYNNGSKKANPNQHKPDSNGAAKATPQQKALLDLHDNFNRHIKFIADRTYLQTMKDTPNSKDENNLTGREFSKLLHQTDEEVRKHIPSSDTQKLIRTTHGVRHASRVAIYIDVLHNFKKTKVSDKDDQLDPFVDKAMNFLTDRFKITEKDIIMLTKLAAFFHDSAREGEGQDYWDHRSAENCYEFLRHKGINEEAARFFANAARYKGDYKNFKNQLKTLEVTKQPDISYCNYIRELIGGADTLDIMRCRDTFEANRLDRFLRVDAHQQNRANAKKLIEAIYTSLDAQDDLEAKKIQFNPDQPPETPAKPGEKTKTFSKTKFERCDNPYGTMQDYLSKNEYLKELLNTTSSKHLTPGNT